MSALERGFKSWAERTAGTVRRELGLAPLALVDPLKVADLIGVAVRTPQNLPGIPDDVVRVLLEEDPYGWHAVSLAIDGGGLLIYNPRKSPARQASDIMHELAHFLLDHKPTTLVVSDELEITVRSFDAKQEEEANWLAWAVLVPREALVACLRRRLSVEAIAQEYGVSIDLVTYRLRITGVEYQFRTRRRA